MEERPVRHVSILPFFHSSIFPSIHPSRLPFFHPSILPSLPSFIPALVIACLTALLFFYKLGAMGLLDPEEGRYAEIPREMIERGDWITPRLNAMRYLEKPPLLYWCVAATYKLFGVSEWSARLWSALPATIGVLAVYAWGARVVSARAGAFSALALATSPQYFALARSLETDMLFSTCLTVALLLGYLGSADGTAGRKYHHGMWVAVAGAMMAKTPIAAVMAVAMMSLHCVVTKQPQQLRRLEWRAGLLLLVALTAPWFIVVSLRNPDFARFFWLEQHVLRYFTGRSQLAHPPHYYLWVVAWGFLPWSLLLSPLALAHAYRWRRGKRSPPSLAFLWCWTAFMFVFFSASQAKLPTYVLPVFPALALLVGIGVDEWLSALPPALARWMPSVVAALAGVMGLLLLRFHDTPACLWFASFAPRSVVLSQRTSRRAHTWQACETLRPLARRIQREWRAGDLVAEYKWYGPSLTFYTHRRHVLIGDWNELTWALERDGAGGYFLEGERDLLALLRGERRVFCVMQRKTLRSELRALQNDIKMQVTHRDLILVSNRAEP